MLFSTGFTPRILRRMRSVVFLLALLPTLAFAQLSGTKTIGTGGDYATIDAAITALVANGVNGPLTFLISSGTYAPPTGGYVLPAVTGMSSTNTVTFKPASGATVTIAGSTSDGTAIFAIDGGKYYIIDGSNSTGGTSRDMLLRQTSTTYGATIWLRNDADYNVIKNATLQSANGTGGLSLTLGGMTVFVGQTTAASGNDSNLIQNNLVGDLSGTYRGFRAIYIYGGSTTTPNIGTRVIGNDVVNFGNVQAACYGIFISYHNHGTLVRGNTVRMTTTSGTTFSQVYGIYINEQLASPLGNSNNVAIEGNKIYGLQTAQTSETIYAITYFGDNNTNSSSPRFVNNMIANDRGATTTTFYGLYVSVTNTSSNVAIQHNSFSLAGSGSYYYLLFLNNSGTATINHRNNIYHSTWSTSGVALYVANPTGWTSNNNLFEINTTAANVAYYNGVFYNSLTAFKAAAAPNETASISGNPQYISPSTGDLHIDVIRATPVESAGAYIATVPTDFDGNTRNTTAPDIGADEGGFNGGGIVMTRPVGGETYLGGASVPFQFTLNRSMPVHIDFSTDGGATWSIIGNYNLTPGTWSGSYTTPDIATTRAMFRVMNSASAVEGDTSGTFSLFQPTVTIVAPNGGEILFQSDNYSIRWMSTDIPFGALVALDYSTDNGASWTEIATNLTSANSPAINSYNWIVPAAQTTQALVRVRMLAKPVSDVSNATFSIRKSMNLLSPNGGEQWFVGETEWVHWSVNRVNKLNVEYSTDNGTTWLTLANGVRAFIDSLRVIVPNTPTTQALVRIVNAEQPQFTERSAATFSILSTALTITSPNGGEKYEQSQPVTVTWDAFINETPLRLEYTSNGVNWETIATGISSGSESYTFTPPAFPTKLARVRLIVEGREMLGDASNGTFEIMEAPGIAIYTPAQGEILMAGSSYEITWGANRVNTVNIEYSPTGGTPGSWQRIASNIPALRSSFTWTVPNQVTPSGKIRIVEVGGSIIAETGLFSIVTPVASVRVLRPNGGEVYTSGDPITINWTSALVGTVNLEYTSDGGASWRAIPGATGIPAVPASFTWTAPAPGTGYRVRVSSGGLYDDSDRSFEIKRAIVPSITILYPNGGENLMVDSAVSITWLARDFTANVSIDLSIDNGATWTPIGTATSASGIYSWTVPATPTQQALVRVTGGGTEDVSDASFVISPRPVPAITVLSPNTADVMWTEGDSVTITWQSNDVATLDIQLSTDGGTTWTRTIAQGIPATPASYGWRVPRLLETVSNSLKLMITGTGGSPSDQSDAIFSYRPAIAGITLPGEVSGLRMIGLFPNPVSTRAEIRWSQQIAGDATLALYGASGEVVDRRELGRREPGTNAATIDASTLAAGVYRYELRIGGAAIGGSMMVVR
ncbi:MAG TPA: hypothetical protein VNA88_18610 [Candidatus Kapabacteria bacterium]|nr:hypothetical protein [Candidatus Kapabacteria bacterium]